MSGIAGLVAQTGDAGIGGRGGGFGAAA